MSDQSIHVTLVIQDSSMGSLTSTASPSDPKVSSVDETIQSGEPDKGDKHGQSSS